MSMFIFFKTDGKIDASNVKLISLHIPKSAGTSFRNTLKSIYGESAVIRLDISRKKIEEERQLILRINEKAYNKSSLSRRVDVLHGHFIIDDLQQQFELPANVPYITWLRHPVERVISNYYYLVERLESIIKEEQRNVDILNKMMRDLREYAKRPGNCNRMASFLGSKPLSSFEFIGIQEHYAEDLAAMSQHFGWPAPSVLHHNKTGSKHAVSEKLRQKIAEWNAEDMALYEEALALRAERLKL